ncbi:DUF998 domain-containing protein [Gordonia sp. CPCC 205333]|uniref:DUF998 domain-containing protein n=1 Tax=Gordonia sp. CPCC 205333 TaxID=3140790 RepID=UPI003AF33904
MISALLIVAMTLATARLALLVTLHVVGRTHYSPVKHAVSDYAVGPTRRLAAAMNAVTAALFATLAAAVWWGYPNWTSHTSSTIYLVVLSAIFVVLPALPTDLEGDRATPIGRAHLIAAVAWFALSYTLTGRFTQLVADSDSSLSGVLHTFNIIAMVSLIALVISLLPALRTRFFGITERIFLGAISIFFLLLPIALLVD